jgi:transposase-like protein
MRGVAHDPVFRAKLMAMHQQGVTLTALSAEFGVAREVLSRWWARYEAEDLAGLQPRSRRPRTSPTRISRSVERRILALRGQRLSAARIAHAVDLGHGTVQRVLEHQGLNQLPQPPRAKPRRYEKQRPGELVHIDFSTCRPCATPGTTSNSPPWTTSAVRRSCGSRPSRLAPPRRHSWST